MEEAITACTHSNIPLELIIVHTLQLRFPRKGHIS